MSKFFELGNCLINAKKIVKVELNEISKSVGVTYDDGKYVVKSFASKEEAEAEYSKIEYVLCGMPKSRSYAVSYFYVGDFSGSGIGLDVFEDVPGKLTASTIKHFSEMIEKSHGLKNVSVLGVISLDDAKV